MAFVPFDGKLDGEEEQPKSFVPFNGKLDEESKPLMERIPDLVKKVGRLPKKILQMDLDIADTAASMMAGSPAQIVGGLVGGMYAPIVGADEANRMLEEIQKSNFGLGEYKSLTKKGKQYSEKVSETLEKPVDWAKDAGEKIAGNEGAYVAELLTRSAMELIDPTVIAGIAGKAKLKRGEKRAKNDADALAKLDKMGKPSEGKPLPAWLSDEEIPVNPEKAAIDQRVRDMNDSEIMRKLRRADQLAPDVAGETDAGVIRKLKALNAVLPEERPNIAGAHDQMIVDRLKNIDKQLPPEVDPSQVASSHDQHILEKLTRLNEALPDAGDFSRLHDKAIIEQLTRLNEILPDMADVEALRKKIAETNDTELMAKLQELDKRVTEWEGKSNETEQHELFDQPEQGRIAMPYEAALGNWRIDEHGIPVKVDLSMEANNLEQPLQRNLWGDENPMVRSSEGMHAGLGMDRDVLGYPQLTKPDNMPENPTPMTQAIDEMPDLPWRAERDEAIDLLRNEVIPEDTATKTYWNNRKKNDQAGFADPKLLMGLGVGAGALALSGADDWSDYAVSAAAAAAAMSGNLARNKVIKLIKQKDGTYISNDPSATELDARLAKAKKEKDGWKGADPNKTVGMMASGGHLEGMKRGSTAIATVAEVVSNAFKRAELGIRKHVFPAEKALRDLSRKELDVLGEVFKKEMFREARFTEGDMLAAGFSPKMMNAYRQVRQMFDHSLKIQNDARAAKGQKPITAVEAYLSSRWSGDFRRPLYNKDGKIVWYLAADSKMMLNAQTRAVLKDHPDLTYDEKKDHVIRFRNRKSDLESAYTTMVDILGRDDPAVEKMQQWMEDQTVGRGATFLEQEKHFKRKGNVHGFIGDRPELRVNDFFDKTIPLIGEMRVAQRHSSEMLSMFQQQIQYAKNAHKWAELQIAGQTVKKILNDKDLVANQPNNIKYIREYFKHAIGYGESAATRAIADSMRNFGFSPNTVDKGVSNVKSYFILTKLAGNVGKMTADAIQLSMMVPHLFDLRNKGMKGNPVTAIAAGLTFGPVMGTGHFYNSLSGGSKFPDIPNADFYNRAAKFAEDNGITARSIYDESPIESSFTVAGKVGNVASRSLSVVETYMRSVAFMTYVQFLKDSGKFKSEIDIFKEAEKRTNISMVDYAQTERPMIFNKLGTTGNFLNTLQTYSWNFYNQYSYFFREARKGNVMPLLAALTTQYMVAGAMGIPGAEDMHKVWMTIKDNLPANMYRKVHENEFLAEPKLWMVKNLGQSSLYGWLSDKTNIGLTSRVAAPSGDQMLSSPMGPAVDIGKQIHALGRAALDPTNSTKWAQSAMLSTPTGFQGALETAPFMEGHTWNYRKNPETGETEKVYKRQTKLEEREGLVTRTPEEESVRRWTGMRTQDEVLRRDAAYATKRNTDASREKSQTLPDAFYDALRRGDKEDAEEYYKTYSYFNGQGISREQIMNRAIKEYTTDIERQKMGAKSVQAMINIKRMQELFDAVEKDQNK